MRKLTSTNLFLTVAALLAAPSVSFADEWYLLKESGPVPAGEGDGVLRLPAAAPPLVAARALPAPLSSGGSLWIDFRILPAAGDWSETNPFVDAAGARLAFAGESTETGRVMISIGGGGAPHPAGVPFATLPWGEAVDWLRVTMEIRRESGVWRLWMDESPEPGEFPLPPGDDFVFVQGHDLAEVRVAGWQWDYSEDNPFFSETSGESLLHAASGMPPAAHAGPPASAGSSGSPPGKAESEGESAAAAAAAGGAPPSVIHVNALTGNDSRCGRFAEVAANGAGPKRSLRAAVEAVDDGGVIVIEAGVYESPGRLGLDGKSITLRPRGSVRFQ